MSACGYMYFYDDVYVHKLTFSFIGPITLL